MTEAIADLNALPLSGERGSLLEALEQVTDPRAKRGIRHTIASTLAMVAAAGLAGSGRSFRSAGDFVADLPQEALARLSARFHPVKRRYIAPNEATIRRHVQMIDADEADAAVGAWLLAQVRAGRLTAGQGSALTAAARAAAGGDRNLAGLVFTADALHVHRDNLQQVIERGGEYIVTVKGNQPGLEHDLRALFPGDPADGASPLTTSPLTAATAAARSAPSGPARRSPAWTSPGYTRRSASTGRSST